MKVKPNKKQVVVKDDKSVLPLILQKDFKEKIKTVAAKKFKTSAAYIREAVLEKMQLEGD